MDIFENWKEVAINVDVPFTHRANGINSFFSVLNYIHQNNWQGACHAASAVLHILFNEQGIDSKLYVGECRSGILIFDHSWIEIDGKVYDAAISNSLIEGISFPPVYSDIDLHTGLVKSTEYGVSTGLGYDQDTQKIKNIHFNDFMSGYPKYKGGLWGMTKDIGSSIGVYLNIARLKDKYSFNKWHEKI